MGQVQGGWIQHPQTSPPVPISVFYNSKETNPAMPWCNSEMQLLPSLGRPSSVSLSILHVQIQAFQA